MATGFLCSAHLCEGNGFQPFSQNWRISRRKEDCTRSVLKNVQSQDGASHTLQQDMWMILHAVCWELEFASWKYGDHCQ